MYGKIIWFVKCFKRGLRYRSFWKLKDWLELVKIEYKVKFSQGENLYQLYEKKYSMYNNYISKYYAPYRLLDYQGCKPMRTDIDDQNIWVCWLQGEDSMPDIVRTCYHNLKIYSNGHNIILLTCNNLYDYLEITPAILSKVGKGLSFTAFSDYIRLNLLSLYGGLWVDATFYITAPLDESIFHTKFYSIKNNVHKNDVVCRYRWAVNFVYCNKNNEIIRHIRNLFCAFWEKNEQPLNYLFMDYCFEYERTVNKDFDELLKQMPSSNEHSHEIRINFNQPFNQELFDKWISDTYLFKLSYKGNLIEATKDGRETFYGHILSL